MSSVDDRIVNMQFNNGQFEKGIAQSTQSLEGLKKGLNLDGIASGVETVASKFNAFGAIGFSVLSNLTNSAIALGKSMLSALTDPLIEGGKKRALAIQQAQFQFKGLGLDIEATMASALEAVKGTAFGLDDAATAAAQFGASGITAGHGLTESLRGIAGVAAQTGSSYADVARVFESVAGNGRLMGQDLLSLSSRGVNAAATLAKSMGTTEAAVREMVTKGEISFEMFSNAMNNAFGANAVNASQTYTGALANMHAALSRIGADVYASKFESQRKVLNAMTPVIDNLHEAIMPLINAFNELYSQNADKLVASLNGLDLSGLKAALPSIAKAMHNVYDAVMSIVKPIKEAFGEIFPPATGKQLVSFAKAIEKFTESLKIGTVTAVDLKKTFRGVFALFDIGFQVIGQIIGLFAKLFGVTTEGSGGILEFTGNIGEFLVKVDDAIKHGTGFTNFFKTLGDVLAVPIAAIKLLAAWIGSFFDKLNGVSTKGFEKAAARIKVHFDVLAAVGNFLVSIWKGLGKIFAAVYSVIGPIIDAISNAFTRLGDAIASGVKTGDFSGILDVINTSLFGGIYLLIKKFVDSMQGGFKLDFSGGLVSSIKDVFGQLTDTLGAMQAKLKAETLKQIAIAVGILAASAVALSLVDPVRLASALGGLTVMMGQMIGSLAVLDKITLGKGLARMPILTGSMIAMATALLILSGAVAIMGHLKWSELAKGLIGVAGGLGIMIAAVKLLSKGTSLKIAVAAGSMTVLATALNILAGALKIFSTISWDEMGRGLTAMAGALGAVVLALSFVPASSIFGAAAIVAVSGGLVILAGALKIMATLSWDDIGRGMATIGASLAILAVGLTLMSDPFMLIGVAALIAAAAGLTILGGALKIMATMSWDDIGRAMTVLGGSLVILAIGLTAMIVALPGAAALDVAAGGLVVLAGALKIMATMSWDDIGRGMVVLGGSMAILAIALTAMILALPGAAALVVAAGALAILAPVLKIMGSMSWDEIGRGLTLLAASLAIIGVAGLLLTPVIPTLMGLGFALLLIGGAVLLAGIGIAALGVGLGAIAISGAAAGAVVIGFISGLIGLIPTFMTAFAEGIVAFANVIATSGPQLTEAFVTVITSLLDAINTLGPQINTAFWNMVMGLSQTLLDHIPTLTDNGMQMIVGILTGIGKNIGQVVDKGTDVIVKFIKGVGDNAQKVTNAGADTIIKFIKAMTETINTRKGEMQTAGRELASAIVSGMTGGLSDKVGEVMAAARRLVSNIPAAIRKLLGINSPSKVTTEIGEFTGQGLAIGLANTSSLVGNSATIVGNSAITSLKKSMAGIASVVSSGIDVNPTITPVLDLSSFKKDSSLIPGMITPPKLALDTSYSSAASIAAKDRANTAEEETDSDGTRVAPAKSVTFIQNNNSPKALSPAEIYRQTKNQLSVVKGELDK